MIKSRVAIILFFFPLVIALLVSGGASLAGVVAEEPFQFTITGEIPLQIRTLARQDSYLYVLDQYSGFHILDLSDPAYPRWAGVLTEIYGWYMNVWGDYAYVTGGSNVLQIIDISDPTNPWLAATYSDFESYQGLYPYTGNVAASNDTLFVEIYYVEVHGQYSCIVGEHIAVMDVSDPLHPQRIDTLDVFNTSPMHANGNVIYTTDEAILDAYDARSPGSPPRLSHLYFSESGPEPYTLFAIRNDYALLYFENSTDLCGYSGPDSWHIVDISEARTPQVLFSDTSGDHIPRHAGDGYYFVWSYEIGNTLEIRRYPDLSVVYTVDDLPAAVMDGHEGFIQAEIVEPTAEFLTTFRLSAVTETVEPAVGATLSYSDTLGMTSFELAPGAVLSPTVVSALPLPRADYPPGGRPQCLAFDIRGHMPAEQRTLQRFQAPVTVTLPISPTKCGADSGPALGWEFLYWERDRWIDAAATCTDTVPNPATQAMTGEDGGLVVHICRPGKYALYPLWLEHYLPASWFQPGWE